MANVLTQANRKRPFPGFGLDFDSVLDDWVKNPGRLVAKDDGRVIPAIDIEEKGDRYVVHADLPGVAQDEIDVSVSDGILTINAESKNEDEQKDEDGRVIRRERSYGKYVRSITLGTEINQDNVKAKYLNGVLTLELPKAEASKPKRIEISTN